MSLRKGFEDDDRALKASGEVRHEAAFWQEVRPKISLMPPGYSPPRA